MKKLFAGLLAVAMLAGCGGSTTSNTGTETGGESTGGGSSETISLVLWGAEEDQTLLKNLVEEFKAAYPDNTFDIQIGVESESTAKDTILTDVEAAADVFAFADDQLPDLVDAGALQPLNSDMDAVLQAQAGKSIADVKAANVEVSVSDATYNDTLYAFPMSADNGYFLYYDSTIFSEDDVKTWDSLLAKAAEAGGGKKVGMTFASGWYNAGFFYGAGFTTGRNADGTTTIDWNGTSADGVKGTDVVMAMSAIAKDPAFMAIADGDISNQINSGNVCAVVSGTWDATAVQDAFGDGYAATVLPTYTAGDKQIQTGSVGGCKLVGVNAYSKNTGWAVLLADFITNENSQVERFNARQIGPSNKKAQASGDVQANTAIAAVLAQSQFAVIQKVGGNYWGPAGTFGENIAQGNISDEAAAQAALDEMVAGVTAPVQ